MTYSDAKRIIKHWRWQFANGFGEDAIDKILGLTDESNDLRAQLAAVTAERDAAVSALALATGTEPGRGTGVWMTLDKWTAMHTERDRYGADQWQRGAGNKDPQEFDEWKREQE